MATQQYSFPVSGLDLTNLEQTHNKVEITPFGDPSISYSLTLPKTWVTESDMGAQSSGIGEMTRIGLFAENSSAPSKAIVQVFSTRLPFEVSLVDWMEFEAERYQTRLLTCKPYVFPVGPVVDAGGIYGPTGNEHVVRLVAHADSARIFMVVAMVAAARYSAVQRDIAIAVSSFKLQKPAGAAVLENYLTVSGGDPSFDVVYPMSWVSRAVTTPIPGKSGVDLLLSRDQLMMAYVRVKAVRRDIEPLNLTTAVSQATAELREAAVELTSNWQPDLDSFVNQQQGLKGALLAKALLNSKPVEVRLALLERKSLWFAVTLLSVLKSDDRVLWMRSKRAYEIALASVKPTT